MSPKLGLSAATSASRQPFLSAYGLQGWTMDPIRATTTQVATSGTLYVSRVDVTPGATLANFETVVSTVGASITLVRGALYSLSGSLVASTANVAASWTTTGPFKHAFSTPYVVPAGVSEVYLGFLTVAGTGPTVARSPGASGGAMVLQMGMASGYRAATLTGLTDIPSPMGAVTASNIALLMAVS